MNYYEELGLDPGATSDEIKRAYKRLTRLLHPDHQQDPELRDMAERQMRRLNDIQETLTDPAKRAAYDQTLAGPPIVLRTAPRTGSTIHVRVTSSLADYILSGSFIRSGWTWVGILVCSIVIVAAWFPSGFVQPDGDSRQPLSALSATPEPLPQPVNPGLPQVSPETPRTSGVPSGRPIVQMGSPSRPGATAVPNSSSINRTGLTAPAPGIVKPVSPAASEPGPATKPVEPRAAVQNSDVSVPKLSQGLGSVGSLSDGNSVTGSWLYSRNPDEKIDPKQYPADYIELKLTDNGGKLRGSYKATYLVLDRAISPRVAFLFEGDPKGVEFSWQGNGGAEGKIRLIRKSTHSMEINWFATQMGTELGLGSGSAILYRRQGY